MVDLSNDRKSVETQISGFIRKGQVIPFRVLQHYSHILGVEKNAADVAAVEAGEESVHSIAEVSGTISNTSSIELVPANENALELVIQNRSLSEDMLIRIGSSVTPSNGVTVPPSGIVTFKDFAAKQAVYGLGTSENNVPYYSYRILTAE